MTPHDFTMWALGFVETVKRRPTAAQWEMFKTKHAKVIGLLMKQRLTGSELYTQARPLATSSWPPLGTTSLSTTAVKLSPYPTNPETLTVDNTKTMT